MQLYIGTKEIPCIRLTIPFIVGIIIANSAHYILSSILLVCINISIILFYYLLSKKLPSNPIKDKILSIFLNLMLFVAGFTIYTVKANRYNSMDIPNGNYIVTGKIIKPIEELQNYNKVTLKTYFLKDSVQYFNYRFKILAYLKQDSSTLLIPGTVLTFSSYINDIKYYKNPGEFNYSNYLYKKGVLKTTFIDRNKWNKTMLKKDIIWLSNKLRSKLLNIYNNAAFDEQTLSVLSAITLGYRNDISEDTEKSFSRAGLMHLLAVSGLHVGIIYFVLLLLFKWMNSLKYGRLFQFIIIVLLLWMYALITGLASSVIRATVMFSFIQLGRISRKPPNIFNILAFTAFVILIFDPFQLFMVGFQLSFLAVLGIVYFQPKLYTALIFKNTLMDKIWMLFTVSVAAQLGTAPISIHYFNYFPTYFWISNIFAIPLITFVIYGVILMLIASFIGIPLDFLSKIINSMFHVIFYLTEKINHLPYSEVSNIHSSPIFTILAYFTILFFAFFVYARKLKHLIPALIVLIFMQLLNIYNKTKSIKQKTFTVFNIPRFSACSYSNSTKSILFYSGKKAYTKSLNYFTDGYFIQNGTAGNIERMELTDSIQTIAFPGLTLNNQQNISLFDFNNNKILKLSEDFKGKLAEKLSIDYLIISKNFTENIEDYISFNKIKAIIIDSSNSINTINFWIKKAERHHIPIHIIKQHGAYTIGLL